MKKYVCLLLLLAVVLSQTFARGDELRQSLNSLGESIADAAKEFGSSVADASKSMYESVKDSVEENGPRIIDEASSGFNNWFSEALPKVKEFFSGFWNSIGLGR